MNDKLNKTGGYMTGNLNMMGRNITGIGQLSSNGPTSGSIFAQYFTSVGNPDGTSYKEISFKYGNPSEYLDYIPAGVADPIANHHAATKQYVDNHSMITIKDGDDFNDLKTPGVYHYIAPMVDENSLLNAPGVSSPAGPAIIVVSKIRNGNYLCQTVYDTYAFGYASPSNRRLTFWISCREYNIKQDTWTDWISEGIH